MSRIPAAVNRLENGHDTEPNDCAIVSIGCYLGIPYTDVIRTAARVVDHGGRNGLTLPVMRRIATLFDAPLITKREFDPEDSYGIVVALPRGGIPHASVVRSGLVLDRLTVWEWTDWLRHYIPARKRKDGRSVPWTAEWAATRCLLLVVKE